MIRLLFGGDRNHQSCSLRTAWRGDRIAGLFVGPL